MAGCPSPLQAEQARVPGSWRGLASQSAPCPGTLQESTISRPGGTPASKPKPTGGLRAGGAVRRPLAPVAPREAGARPRFHPPSIALTPLLWVTAPAFHSAHPAPVGDRAPQQGDAAGVGMCPRGMAPGKMQRYTSVGCFFCARHSHGQPGKSLSPRLCSLEEPQWGREKCCSPCGDFSLQPLESRCSWALRVHKASGAVRDSCPQGMSWDHQRRTQNRADLQEVSFNR